MLISGFCYSHSFIHAYNCGSLFILIFCCFSAGSMDYYQAQCWIQTFAIFSFRFCLSDFWEVEGLWTTCITNIFSESHFVCDNICRDFLEIYVWAVLHYCFTLNIFKLVLLAGRRWRFRARTANGKTPASFSCTSFRLYCCFISGMIFYATSVHYVVDGSKCQKPKYCGFSNN